MDQQINISNITLNHNESNLCKNFIHNIDGGYQLGIFIEIKNPRKTKLSLQKDEFDSLCDFISSGIKSEYEHNHKESAFIRFENTLNKAEPILNSVSENKSSLLNKISLLILASKNNELYFAKHGKIYACLFRDGALINISPKSTKITTPIKTNSKIFPHIINAKIKNTEKILFLNETSGEYCEQNQLETWLNHNTDEELGKLKEIILEHQPLSSANFTLLSIEEASQRQPEKQSLSAEAINTSPENDAFITKEKLPIGAIISKTQKSIDILSNNISAILKTSSTRAQSFLGAAGVKARNISPKAVKLNKKTKVVVAACGVVVIAILFQVYVAVAAKNQFQEFENLISNKKNEAGVLLANSNNADAIRKLLEARQLTASITSQLPSFKEEADQISGDVENEINKLAKITNITNPEKVIDLSNFGIKFEPKNIFKSGGQLMITGTEFGLVYKIDLETKRKGFSFFSTKEDKIISAAKSSNAISFFSESGKTYIFYPASQNVTELNLIKNNDRIISLSEKTIDLYDRNSSEIKVLSQNNLSPINKVSPQSKILAMTSDNQSIFAITDDNKIIKITGSKQEQIADLTSLLLFENPTAIHTNDNTSKIYITNKTQIAIYSKNGEFIGQYNIGEIKEIVDINISDDKEIFLLSPGEAYRITI